MDLLPEGPCAYTVETEGFYVCLLQYFSLLPWIMLDLKCSHLQIFYKLIKCFIYILFVNIGHMHMWSFSSKFNNALAFCSKVSFSHYSLLVFKQKCVINLLSPALLYNAVTLHKLVFRSSNVHHYCHTDFNLLSLFVIPYKIMFLYRNK